MTFTTFCILLYTAAPLGLLLFILSLKKRYDTLHQSSISLEERVRQLEVRSSELAEGKVKTFVKATEEQKKAKWGALMDAFQKKPAEEDGRTRSR